MQSIQSKKFKKFFFEICSTLIISISVDMFVGQSIQSKKKIFQKKILKFVLPLSVFPSICWQVDLVEKLKNNLICSTLISISVGLLGSRSRRKKNFFQKQFLKFVLPLLGSQSSRKKKLKKQFFSKFFFLIYPYLLVVVSVCPCVCSSGVFDPFAVQILMKFGWQDQFMTSLCRVGTGC